MINKWKKGDLITFDYLNKLEKLVKGKEAKVWTSEKTIDLAYINSLEDEYDRKINAGKNKNRLRRNS